MSHLYLIVNLWEFCWKDSHVDMRYDQKSEHPNRYYFCWHYEHLRILLTLIIRRLMSITEEELNEARDLTESNQAHRYVWHCIKLLLGFWVNQTMLALIFHFICRPDHQLFFPTLESTGSLWKETCVRNNSTKTKYALFFYRPHQAQEQGL